MTLMISIRVGINFYCPESQCFINLTPNLIFILFAKLQMKLALALVGTTNH